MEAWRKATATPCRALLVLLIVVSTLAGAAVSTAQDEGCWKDDNHHPICMTEDCRLTCKDHGHEDGRCNWGWGNLIPICQCLTADCH
ncbi:hypothetical protein HU200_025997 [Digitaria exilis]|uniref:Defensin n=1 Tax=Digitaria exilis TaxID=1010633 RepID=A0A835C1J4_9POAL|nr:hypothetical protein HU200_025997 [Digitaria exilis]